MIKMNIQMPMKINQLDWLTRPFVNNKDEGYFVRFNFTIGVIGYLYADPVGGYTQIPTPLELSSFEKAEIALNGLKHLEGHSFEGTIEGKELRRYFLNLKKSFEKQVSEYGIGIDYFELDVNFEVEELLKVY
jgi:hypothetical protein